MTLVVETESHGEVEAGFHGPFVQFTRFGEYSFVTKHFCGLLVKFANDPRLRSSVITAYNLDKFWEREGDYIGEIMGILSEDERYRPQVERNLDRQKGEVLMEDDTNLKDEGRIIQMALSQDNRCVDLGDYKLSTPTFQRFALYIAKGGIFGWGDKRPEFARQALAAIEKSDSHMFKGYDK